ncbi:MAG TPA: PQQ-dependent sugar dehydrogenase [Vicinamibacterales bacterium]
MARDSVSWLVIAVALLSLPSSAFAQVQLTPVATGLSSPVFVGNAGDGSQRLFIVEQRGIIRVLPPVESTPTIFLDIRAKIATEGEQGLLGLAFHPQYAKNGRFFVYYTRVGDGAIVVAEYRVPDHSNIVDPTEIVLLTIPHPTNTNHNGGMLAFGFDGYLYVGVGDGGGGNDEPNNAQNIDVLLGKILRIDVDRPGAGTPYSPPPDNPFVNGPGRDEIFAFGFRNPWRFSFDRATGEHWVGDVGQDEREEVDRAIVKGGNYGWRIYEGFRCTNLGPSLCNPSDYVDPLFDYFHTRGRCSVTGGYVYRGSQGTLPAGAYVYGDFCSGEIVVTNGNMQAVLMYTAMHISSFGEDEQGELYVVDWGGTVSRLESTPASCTDAIVSAAGRPGNCVSRR